MSSAGLVEGCGAPVATLGEDPEVEIVGQEAHLPELLWWAVMTINGRCPEFGSVLVDMYNEGTLNWGDTGDEPYGMSERGSWGSPGAITFNQDMYIGGADPEMLIADLFHEAGHSLGNEFDGDPYYDDPWRRPDLNGTSYDLHYLNNTCPTSY